MTPSEAAAILRQFSEWRSAPSPIWRAAPTTKEVNDAIDAVVEMIERVTATTTRITSAQAPSDLKKYWPIASQCYAKGWNDCIKDVLEKSK